MSRGVNKVILLGNVGKAPQSHQTKSGTSMSSFSIGTQENWTDKATGEKKDRTEWHRIVCFNKLSDIVVQYVTVGSQVYIEGSLKTRKWQDPESGVERYTTEIIAREVNIVSSKSQSEKKTTHAQQNILEKFPDDDIPF